MPKDVVFEPLLYIAGNAYKLKTTQEFSYLPLFNYETYSNKDGLSKRVREQINWANLIAGWMDKVFWPYFNQQYNGQRGCQEKKKIKH